MFWDSVAGVYDLFVNVVNRMTHLTLRKIVANLIQPGDSVLECACGTGLLTGVIAQKCGHLTATDFAPKMLAKARKNCADRKSTRLNSSHPTTSRMPSSA